MTTARNKHLAKRIQEAEAARHAQRFSQHEHRRAIESLKTLSPAHRLVGLELNRRMGKEHTSDFGKPLVLAVGLIADSAGVSESSARRALKRLCDAGLYKRIDSRRGGRDGVESAAIWVPLLPRWWNKTAGRQGCQIDTHSLSPSEKR